MPPLWIIKYSVYRSVKEKRRYVMTWRLRQYTAGYCHKFMTLSSQMSRALEFYFSVTFFNKFTKDEIFSKFHTFIFRTLEPLFNLIETALYIVIAQSHYLSGAIKAYISNK